ncbi:Nif3-like dinuclear metal center hexameric protein [Aureicoccus marinus]|uniref:GTP cyclohydrolase 1 type 2 homolog n=1 Tax=Aureicoccus marinus TaxID=754435 RepID=A0A2S7T6R8_9FLAO|nr:Nif3-like dinuclear metal center hexameric protein [Aureicoccus marinus]PQJ15612.1 Nif3-like dinuclear metal center hexameric protein [Aureicoccus marinus]
MKVADVHRLLEDWAPSHWSEEFDNTGLLVGDPQSEVTGILVSLDCLENVVEEAEKKGCNLIVCFHPIIFKGLKKITGKTYVERVVLKAIQKGIAIYALHTRLDNHREGVNDRICEQLGLDKRQILLPKSNELLKLITYVPKEHAEALKQGLFEAGAGSVGNYSDCSFSMRGQGQYKPSQEANPHQGVKGELEKVEELQLQVLVEKSNQHKVHRALLKNHPYEEVAHEWVPLANEHQDIGMGMLGEFSEAIEIPAFLKLIKTQFGTPVLRHSNPGLTSIKKVAVLGGSGAFAINAARRAGADAFLTADLKYHNFFEAENQLLLVDIGHYESEQFTKNLICEYLSKKISSFAVTLAESITNPINYF